MQIARTRSSGVFRGTREIRVSSVARDSDAIELDIAGHAVRITSPGKVLFSERGETKLDLVNYYLAITEPFLRAMGGRPVLMERYPHGAEGSSFFQKARSRQRARLAHDHDRQHAQRHVVTRS